MDGSGDGLADFEPMSNPVITKAPDEKKAKVCLHLNPIAMKLYL